MYNLNFEQVPCVELVAATSIADVAYKSELAQGDRPRQLHSRAIDAAEAHIVLSMQIHDRVWVPRERLARLQSPTHGIRDLPGDPSGRYKEWFSNWLARSYTRIELPDDFNDALSKSGLKEKVLYKLKAYSTSVHGIFLQIALVGLPPRSEDDEEDVTDGLPLTPSEVARAKGPYTLSIVVVIYEECSKETHNAIRSLLASIREEKLPIDRLPEGQRDSRKKCSIADLAASLGVYVEGADIVGVKGWTVHDLMRTLRFTDQDYLSSAAETGD